ncbi:MAG: nitrile hydratase [Rhodospirillaceae bacterium]|nr:nitrile hydratase [Rhodospirillaceae bacterium]HAA91513.1 nitrile hydratase [Rhodospirillaceae bacterium]|tara:strand:- start:535 stop:819 length:285 start_codon:yes stop_codon:yes gene_type:complete
MTIKFNIGESVQVREAYPDGHIRTPLYARGKNGVVESYVGMFPNPEELAVGKADGPKLPLYRVRFQQTDLWSDYDGDVKDTTIIDLYEHWLENA